MMAMLQPDAALARFHIPSHSRGSDLIDMYQKPPYSTLLAVAITLHTLTKKVNRSASWSPDIQEVVMQPIVIGAILGDLRDVLKFRFRCEGLVSSEKPPNWVTLEGLRTSDMDPALLAAETEEEVWSVIGYVINYVITACDNLSRDFVNEPPSSQKDFSNTGYGLRDLLRSMLRLLHYRGEEAYDALDCRIFDSTG